MKPSRPYLLELLIVIYCVWSARDLSWQASPYMRGGTLAFIIWGFPVAFGLAYDAFMQLPHRMTVLLLAIGLLLSFIGVLGDLNALRYLGLALALAGLLPFSWPMLIWIPSAASWMPASGYFLSSLPLPLVVTGEVAIALIGTVAMMTPYWWRKV